MTENYEKRGVIFTEKQRVAKSNKHPELRNKEFINGLVKNAVYSPDFVYEDLANPKKRHIYYLIVYTINKTVRYVKVVVDITSIPMFIVTAFQPNNVKERGKTNIIYGKDI